MINARSETVPVKPAFREALLIGQFKLSSGNRISSQTAITSVRRRAGIVACKDVRRR